MSELSISTQLSVFRFKNKQSWLVLLFSFALVIFFTQKDEVTQNEAAIKLQRFFRNVIFRRQHDRRITHGLDLLSNNNTIQKGASPLPNSPLPADEDDEGSPSMRDREIIVLLLNASDVQHRYLTACNETVNIDSRQV